MMRHTEKMKMGLALAGLLFCMTSAAQTLTKPTSHEAVSAASTVSSTLASRVQHQPIIGPMNPTVIWRRKLVDDDAVRLITLGNHAHIRVMNRRESPQSFGRFVDSLVTAHPVETRVGKPIRYVALFYRQDGTLDWSVDIMQDNTLYDPMHNCYLRTATDVTHWFNDPIQQATKPSSHSHGSMSGLPL